MLERAQFFTMLRGVANFVKSNPVKFGPTVSVYVGWQTDRELPGVAHEDERWIARFNELAAMSGRLTGYTPTLEQKS